MNNEELIKSAKALKSYCAERGRKGEDCKGCPLFIEGIDECAVGHNSPAYWEIDDREEE